MTEGNEVWQVKIRSYKFLNEIRVYHVFASSATMAEKAGLALAKSEKLDEPYCVRAEFHCEVY